MIGFIIEFDDLGLSSTEAHELRDRTLLALSKNLAVALRSSQPLIETTQIALVLDCRSTNIPEKHLSLLRLAKGILLGELCLAIFNLLHQLQAFLVHLLVLVAK